MSDDRGWTWRQIRDGATAHQIAVRPRLAPGAFMAAGSGDPLASACSTRTIPLDPVLEARPGLDRYPRYIGRVGLDREERVAYVSMPAFDDPGGTGDLGRLVEHARTLTRRAGGDRDQ